MTSTLPIYSVIIGVVFILSLILSILKVIADKNSIKDKQLNKIPQRETTQ